MTDIDAALAAPINYENGVGTLREYLQDLLQTVWREEEGFSGKRPFGNSGWKYDIFDALVRVGLVEGDIDEDGYVENADRAAGEKLVLEAILRVFS